MRRGRAILAMTLGQLLGRTDTSVWFRRSVDRGPTFGPDGDEPGSALASP
jgi:hypothetical protein